MYRMKLWDEDKWNIHSSSYSPSKYHSSSNDKEDDKKYHKQKYDSKEKNANSGFVEDFKEEKWEQKVDEDDIPIRAAKQIFNEKGFETKKKEANNDVKTIEDAIKKAIEDERKIIVLDN